jgi:hypothetical protein
MIQDTTRPLTKAERRVLTKRATVPPVGKVDWMRDERITLIVTVAICAAIVVIGTFMHAHWLALIIAGAIALIQLSGYQQRRYIRRHTLVHRQELAEELEAGQARVIACSPTRIIERPEYEDEGTFWFFDGGDGRYLALCGEESARFPSSQFEVVIGARHGWIIGIRSRGTRVASTLVVNPEDVAWESFPNKGYTVFSAPPNAELREILSCYATAVE